MKNDYTIFSERFKKEVDEAHADFFKRRGMNPNDLPTLWGSDYTSLSSEKKRDQPKQQSLPESFLLADILKQMSGEGSETTSH